MNPIITIKNLTNSPTHKILNYIEKILFKVDTIEFEHMLTLEFESGVKAEIVKNKKSLDITIFGEEECKC